MIFWINSPNLDITSLPQKPLYDSEHQDWAQKVSRVCSGRISNEISEFPSNLSDWQSLRFRSVIRLVVALLPLDPMGSGGQRPVLFRVHERVVSNPIFCFLRYLSVMNDIFVCLIRFVICPLKGPRKGSRTVVLNRGTLKMKQGGLQILKLTPFYL
jgi:hypothetical protein